MTWHDLLILLLLLLVVAKLGLTKVRHWIWAHPMLIATHAIAVQGLGYLISLSRSMRWARATVFKVHWVVPDNLKYAAAALVAIVDMAITMILLLKNQSRTNIGINTAALLSKGSRTEYATALDDYGVTVAPEDTVPKLLTLRAECRDRRLNGIYDSLIEELTSHK